MKTIVFGANGFIGSHVVSALLQSNNDVIAVVRDSSKSTYLNLLDVEIKQVNYSDSLELESLMTGQDVVYNCTAAKKNSSSIDEDGVEMIVTKKLVNAAINSGIEHFIELSSIIIYDFEKEGIVDETYEPIIKTSIQAIQKKREAIVIDAGKSKKMLVTIVRPATVIGERGERSFFAKLVSLDIKGKFPIVDDGKAMTSFVDARDLGKAMTDIAEKHLTGLYLLKSFDVSWIELKNIIDDILDYSTPYCDISLRDNSDSDEYQVFSINRIWSNSKSKNKGINPIYSVHESIKKEIDYLKLIEKIRVESDR